MIAGPEIQRHMIFKKPGCFLILLDVMQRAHILKQAHSRQVVCIRTELFPEGHLLSLPLLLGRHGLFPPRSRHRLRRRELGLRLQAGQSEKCIHCPTIFFKVPIRLMCYIKNRLTARPPRHVSRACVVGMWRINVIINRDFLPPKCTYIEVDRGEAHHAGHGPWTDSGAQGHGALTPLPGVSHQIVGRRASLRWLRRL